MNRRRFFRRAALGAAAVATGSELLERLPTLLEAPVVVPAAPPRDLTAMMHEIFTEHVAWHIQGESVTTTFFKRRGSNAVLRVKTAFDHETVR